MLEVAEYADVGMVDCCPTPESLLPIVQFVEEADVIRDLSRKHGHHLTVAEVGTPHTWRKGLALHGLMVNKKRAFEIYLDWIRRLEGLPEDQILSITEGLRYLARELVGVKVRDTAELREMRGFVRVSAVEFVKSIGILGEIGRLSAFGIRLEDSPHITLGHGVKRGHRVDEISIERVVTLIPRILPSRAVERWGEG